MGNLFELFEELKKWIDEGKSVGTFFDKAPNSSQVWKAKPDGMQDELGIGYKIQGISAGSTEVCHKH